MILAKKGQISNGRDWIETQLCGWQRRVYILLWVVGVQAGSMASAHALRASRLLAYARQL